MATAVTPETNASVYPGPTGESSTERPGPWPVNWSGICIGALAALAASVVFGLAGVSIGTYVTDPTHRVVDPTAREQLGIGTLWFGVFAAFLAFVIGGWVAGKVAGVFRAETGMLHGAVAWLLAMPAIVLLAALGAGSVLGGWYTGLASQPSWAGPDNAPYYKPFEPGENASTKDRQEYSEAMEKYRTSVQEWRDPKKVNKATRYAALGAVTALLLGLMGAVVGGWMASGEPMTLTYVRATESDHETLVRV